MSDEQYKERGGGEKNGKDASLVKCIMHLDGSFQRRSESAAQEAGALIKRQSGGKQLNVLLRERRNRSRRMVLNVVGSFL